MRSLIIIKCILITFYLSCNSIENNNQSVNNTQSLSQSNDKICDYYFNNTQEFIEDIDLNLVKLAELYAETNKAIINIINAEKGELKQIGKRTMNDVFTKEYASFILTSNKNYLKDKRFNKFHNFIKQQRIIGYYFLFGQTESWAIEKGKVYDNVKNFEDYLFEDLKQSTTCTFDIELDDIKWNFSFWERREEQYIDKQILLLIKGQSYQKIQVLMEISPNENETKFQL